MNYGFFLLIVLFIIGLSFIWPTLKNPNPALNPSPDLNTIETAVKTLTRQAARWSTAAKQDQNPLIAVLHANYGAGYLWAINDIVTSAQFNSITGLDYTKFRDEIVKIQDDATKKMAAVCPGFAPEPSYLTQVSGE